MFTDIRRASLAAACLSITLVLSGCDSDSGAKITGNGSALETGDFFDEHFNDRPEYAHYSAHDMDTNRRDTGSYDELAIGAALPDTFANWESPHVHPLDLTPDSNLLLAVNTADAKLEVFRVEGNTPVNIDAIPVGLDPISVRARSNTEAWVVNQISDSVSIVDLTTGVVRHTLQTEDEPADVIFAGDPQRAFVTASQANTVMVFDPANLNAEPQIIAIAGEDPRALAVSLDGNTVYAAVFESGNASTVVRGGRTNRTAGNYLGADSPLGPYGGQNPPPNDGNTFTPALNAALPVPPRVSMIVKKDATGRWMDDNNGDWSALVSGVNSGESGRVAGWDLPDNDVAIIDANTLDVTYQSSLMNMVMGISVNPRNGRVVVVGTDARNEVRFEPNLKSHFVTATFADFETQGGAVRLRDLNSHLDPEVTFLPENERALSIGEPRSITWGPSGLAGYVTAMGSNSVLQINRNGSRRSTAPIQVGEGPTASIVHVPSTRLLVLNRFDASISVVNTSTRTEEQRVPFSFDPTPDFVNQGRRLLYDTQAFSGLGQASCASCHVDARQDRLAWDLGNPSGEMEFAEGFPFHPMKGPMRTTSLVGIIGSPVLHFRGDKETLPDFSPTYTNLQGMLTEPTADEMNQLETFIDTIRVPPNPFRNLDNTMPELVLIPGPEGRVGNPHNPSNDCTRCHDPDSNSRGGLLNGGGNSPGQQTTTSPSLRSMHEILGMSLVLTDSTSGYGFIADGAMDTQTGNTLRNNNSLALMMAWNGDAAGDTHAAVGTQVTLNDSQTAEDTATLTQLVALAANREIGLVAHGLRNNGRGQRGFAYLPDTDQFQTMTESGSTTLDNLTNLANAEFPITFTAVPEGTEIRIGVDRDDDGTFDLDIPNNNGPTEPGTTTPRIESFLAGWSFDSNQFSNAANGVTDLTGEFNGTATNVTAVTENLSIPGATGSCHYAEFNGTNSSITFGNPDELNFTGQITLSAWIRPDQSGGGIRNVIAHTHQLNPRGAVYLRLWNGRYQIGSWTNTGDHLASANIPAEDAGTGAWVHLAGTYDGTTWRLYRNGVQVAENADPVGAVQVNNNWSVGAFGAGDRQFFDGGIAEPRIFNIGLNATEIQELMNATPPCDNQVIPVVIPPVTTDPQNSVSNPLGNNTIAIDGNLTDWSSLVSFGTDPNETDASNPIDWQEAWMAHDSSQLYIAYNHDSPVTDSWGYGIYVDADADPNTGFRGFSDEYPIGIDYIIEAEYIQRYTGTGTNWSWEDTGIAQYAINGNSAELSFPLSLIGNPTELNLFFRGDNNAVAPGSTAIDYFPDPVLDANADLDTRHLSYTVNATNGAAMTTADRQ